jgi:tetratricopeptide (TPR) repeat protein
VGQGLPLVLLFEDLHHADPGLLDLIEHLLESARFPLYLLAFTRPELLDRRPSLATGRRTTPIYLEPLADPAMAQLVDGLVEGLPESARAALVTRSEGVPLYAVETVRSLIDRDAVVPLEGRYVFVDHSGDRVDLSTLAAPASLQTLIAARLDALSPAERRAVQDASVLGLSFTREGLLALSGPDVEVDAVLDSLLRKEILEVQNDPRSPERGQYRFLQALVRQVAYDTLSRRDRKGRHLAAAAHLAEAFDDAGDLAAVLAQHHLDALDASSTDDRDHEELALQARSLLVRAASRAEALGSPDQALRHVETALARDPRGVELAELQRRAARNARLAGQTDKALSLARAAKAGYTAAGRELDAIEALMIEAMALRQQSRLQEAVDLLTPVYEELHSRTDAGPQLYKVTSGLAGAHVFLGQHDLAQRYGLEALMLAEAEGDAADIADALYRVSLVLLYMGSPTASRALLHETIRVSREDGLTGTLSLGLNNLASLTYPRDLAAALPHVVEALALCEQLGDRGRAAVSLINILLIEWLLGDWESIDQRASGLTPEDMTGQVYAGLTFLLSVVAWSRGEPVAEPTQYGDDLGDAYDRASVLGILALRKAQAGDHAAAAEMAERGLRDYHASYGYEDDLVLFWSVAVDLALAAGDLPRVRALLALSASAPVAARTPLLTSHELLFQGLLAQREGRDPEPQLRDAITQLDAYGAAVRLAQAKAALGGWLAGQGRGADAEPLLDDAARTFTALRAQPALAELAAAREPVGR